MLVKATRTAPLSSRELYLFDTTGHLEIRGMLDAAAVEYCREQVLSLPSRVMPGRGDKRRFDDIINSVPALGELARSHEVRQLVAPLINQPYRVIESYVTLVWTFVDGLAREVRIFYYDTPRLSRALSQG